MWHLPRWVAPMEQPILTILTNIASVGKDEDDEIPHSLTQRVEQQLNEPMETALMRLFNVVSQNPLSVSYYAVSEAQNTDPEGLVTRIKASRSDPHFALQYGSQAANEDDTEVLYISEMEFNSMGDDDQGEAVD